MNASQAFTRLTLASLRHRAATALITTVAIAVAVALLLGVELVRRGVKDSFSASAGGTDLIVGARGSGVQLLLYSLFGLGAPTRNLDPEVGDRIAGQPGIAWTIPIALGDSFAGFRVVATNDQLFEHWRIRRHQRLALERGRFFGEGLEAVAGAEVAREQHLEPGDSIVLRHGLGLALQQHDDHPFTVVGRLEPTGGPLDRAIFIPLAGLAEIHAHGEHGAAEGHSSEAEHYGSEAQGHDPDEEVALAAIFVGLENRATALDWQRRLEANTEGGELTAILPGVTLTELWQSWRPVEDILRFFTVAIVVVALLGLTVALRAAVEERRRELAILRALGVGPARLAGLVLLETLFLACAGIALGIGGAYAAIAWSGPTLESRAGLSLPLQLPSGELIGVLALILVAALLLGGWPALRAYRQSLNDGLEQRL